MFSFSVKLLLAYVSPKTRVSFIRSNYLLLNFFLKKKVKLRTIPVYRYNDNNNNCLLQIFLKTYYYKLLNTVGSLSILWNDPP